MSPARAIPAPLNVPLDLRISPRAICPQTIAAMLPNIGRNVSERIPRMRLATAKPEFCPGLDATAPPGKVCIGGGGTPPPGSGGVRPGKDVIGTQPAAPSAQARSVGNRVPAASWHGLLPGKRPELLTAAGDVNLHAVQVRQAGRHVSIAPTRFKSSMSPKPFAHEIAAR